MRRPGLGDGIGGPSLGIQPLGSGSKGNAVLIRAADTRVLVDAGLERGELLDRLDRVRLRLGDLDAILVSHAHGDHTRSVGTLSRRGRIPVHATQSCLERLGTSLLHRAEILPRNGVVEIGALRVHTFVLEHDAPDTLGFRFEAHGRALGYATDLGSYGGALFERLRGVQGLYLEFNYDPVLLRNGPYDAELRARIAGPRGHLSNAQAATVLRRLAHPGLEYVYLAHVSLVNNTPELAQAAASAALEGVAPAARILLAAQHDVSPASELDRGPAPLA